MENVLDLLDPNKSFRRIVIPCSINRKRISNDMSLLDKEINFHDTSKQRSEPETDYVKEYRRKDDEEYLKLVNNMIQNKNNPLDNMSDVTAEEMLCKENATQIYETYNFAYEPKIHLPVHSVRDDIISMIASNSVVVIRGSTGCGKSTQVPQFILDAEFKNKRHCNIIVTQPRRIAALSIAKRVSQERDWPIGTIVGYQMGLVKNTCCDTHITYCTTGVLLHKFVNKKHMMQYTHVILDEIHERDEDMDFLLLVVKKLLRTSSPMVKVILMSATIDVHKFANYFSSPVGNELLPAPIISIPGGYLFDVSIYYMDEMTKLGNIPEFSADEPKFTRAMIEFCVRTVHIFDSIDRKSNNKNDLYSRPAVLIFLPGIQEIEEVYSELTTVKQSDAKWNIIVLHSLISTNDQENIFKQQSKDYRRIILSTNIAESSITVPDVKYVIDFCMTKLLITNFETNYQCLKLCWASKTNCQQRAGRAGRVMDGRVYRMVPKSFYDNVLQDENVPEILRAPFANIILKTKMLDMGEPKALLALSLDPPSLSNLRNTILMLKEVGALLNRPDKQDLDGDLTYLGYVMASLPLSIYITKLIVLGHLFGVLQDAIIIGASMSVKEMFNIRFKQAGSTYFEKFHWAANSDSDCIACLNAFKVWRNDKANHRITSSYTEREWARRNNLRVKTLREIDALVTDITKKLYEFGIKETGSKYAWEEHSVDRTFVLKVIIAGAFYPNYFVKSLQDIDSHKENIMKTLPGDPTNTVYLQGWPSNQPGQLYARKFQEIFAEQIPSINREDITVSFDESNRVYIEYNKNDEAKNHCSFVRNSIKIRQCRIPIEIDLLNERVAHSRAKAFGLTNEKNLILFHNGSSFNVQETQLMLDNSKSYPKLPAQSEYQSSVVLQGPFSPIEISLTHLVTMGKLKTVNIEATSVNSILLDTCSNNSRVPFLVAQSINQNSKNETKLMLRNTTLLPNIPGLAALIILIFTPYMELRRSPLGTYYTGALCGLGYDYCTRESIFPEHDLEIVFDVEITINDLQAINKLRHWMNVAMHFGDDLDDSQSKLTIKCQNHIRDSFTEIIYKDRKQQDPLMTSNFHKWNRYDKSLFLESAGETSEINTYCLHKALELNKRNIELEETLKHLSELEILAYNHRKQDETEWRLPYCKLCSVKINNIKELHVHLCTKEHESKKQAVLITSGLEEDLQDLMHYMKL